MSVRVRFAPSPTGSPHVGNIRTALFCHLMAKGKKGTNILRIEDTDRERAVPGCQEEIEESLQWMGIEFQEGPIIQSERAAAGVYDKQIQVLLESGHAYKAFDTPEELTEMRAYQKINKQPIGYFGGIWRDATPGQVSEAAGKPVIRLKMPRNRTLVVQDAIRGRVEFDSNNCDDPVLIKADGMPTYHCAAMVDDHLMDISHVIRGEEWISSAPKHVWLFEAFGWTPPLFVHVPVIKGKDGAKLSKRHGDTRCLDYRAAGYMPEALANFIALIGWSPGGDREIMSMDEMAEVFDLSGLQPSAGIFDLDKLNWMSGNYIRSTDNLVEKVKTYCEAPDSAGDVSLLKKAFSDDPSYASAVVELERERVTTLADFGPASSFFFEDMPTMDPAAVEKWLKQNHVPGMFATFSDLLPDQPDKESCEKMIRDYAAANGFEKLGPVVHPTRVALTGRTAGPGLFELMALLGNERMVKRFRAMWTGTP